MEARIAVLRYKNRLKIQSISLRIFIEKNCSICPPRNASHFLLSKIYNLIKKGREREIRCGQSSIYPDLLA